MHSTGDWSDRTMATLGYGASHITLILLEADLAIPSLDLA